MCAPFPPDPATVQRALLAIDQRAAEKNGYTAAPAFECKGCGFVNRGMLQFCEQCKRPKG